MKYAYEDLSKDQFEKLVVLIICQKLLGISVQPLANGRCDGRDALSRTK
jgi:hypothetical protein